jgi:DNA-binding FadR family transcriptional regulator
VREAVRSLAAVGMVESRQGAGTFVASASPLTPLDRRLRRAGVAEVYEVRMALELEAARLAAARRTGADLAALRAALAARAAASSPAEFVDADLVFHHAVIAAAHNPVLAELFTHFATALRTALLDLSADTALRSPADRAAATDAHYDLAAAIAAGDGDAAVDATRRNVETTLLQLRDA